MRIGLLVCDHVLPEFRHIAGDYPEMFGRLFSSFPEIELVPYDLVEGEFPVSLDECDGWITTGSKRSVYDDEEWIHRFADLVREAHFENRPFVGICFGHQMMAQALGGHVSRSDRGWGVGVKRVDLAGSIVPGAEDVVSFAVLNSHADQVDVVPPDGEVLGGNAHCPVSVMRIGSRMLGIQGHPEFVPEYSRALMELRRGAVIPDEVVDAGLASLATTPDNGTLASLIVEFLTKP
jgi:GMP synthase-like glutamine amidotransferase